MVIDEWIKEYENNCKYDRQFWKQRNEILLRTEVLCQDIKDIPEAKEWIKQQKNIPYLPKIDIFACYCPMCNNTLNVNCKCKQCGQLINWKYHTKSKLIGEISI
jgi:maltose-binding protein MalE